MNLREYVQLAPYTTFCIGGPARWFAEALSEADIAEAAAFARDAGVPLFALGGGSNLLVSDAGFPGLVVRVALAGVDTESTEAAPGRRIFRVAAGEDWDALVCRSVDEGCAGMECLAGIPGTVGATPVQNVGAYGQEVAQTIVRVRAFDLAKDSFVEFDAEECRFAYRNSRFNTVDRGRYLITRVDFSLVEAGKPNLEYADLKRYFADKPLLPTLQNTSKAVKTIRKNKGMVISADDPDSRSAGSFFKNPIVLESTYERIAAGFAPAPVPHYPAPEGATGEAQVKLPAAWLLEKAGFHRGYVLGEAGISSRHTLALINRGKAQATDILALRDEILARVKHQFDIALEPEPVWLG